MNAPTLAWNIPNLITVTLMVLVTFAIGGLIIRAVRGFNAGKADAQEASAA